MQIQHEMERRASAVRQQLYNLTPAHLDSARNQHADSQLQNLFTAEREHG
jgi:hypothetical protein